MAPMLPIFMLYAPITLPEPAPIVITERYALTAVRPQTISPNNTLIESPVPKVPFFSQFADISSPKWRGIGCGVTSLAMLIEFYEPDSVTVDQLLSRGISSGAYLQNAGWKHQGLIDLSRRYGLGGKAYDLSNKSKATALLKLKEQLADGPVMVSVHYKFDPTSTIPHLAVINGIENGMVYYNDPAGKKGGEKISEEKFLKAWKKRFIVIRPAADMRLSIAQ
jgi:uncharacterized protein YvpB